MYSNTWYFEKYFEYFLASVHIRKQLHFISKRGIFILVLIIGPEKHLQMTLYYQAEFNLYEKLFSIDVAIFSKAYHRSDIQYCFLETDINISSYSLIQKSIYQTKVKQNTIR